jgi:predicted permease
MVSCAVLFRKTVARLVASPLFTVFAVLSLAAGVAVTTAVYSVVDSLMFRRFEATDPHTLAFVMAPRAGVFRATAVSADDVAMLKSGLKSFQRITGATTLLARVASTRNTEFVTVEAVDGDYFNTLGVSAAVGRVLDGVDEQSAARVAMISEEYWRTRFDGDRNVTARTITIDGLTFDVAGVVDGAYGGLVSRIFNTQVWLPLSVASLFERALSSPNLADRELLTVVGRLSPGVTHAAAAAEIETVARQLDASRPLPLRSAQAPIRLRQWTARSALDQGDEDDGLTRVGIILVILVALVLVVACTNLANLVLARSSARQGELAIRMAMGASRGRVIWEQCAEGLILSCLGAAASYMMFIGLSAWMTQQFTIPLPGMGRLTLAIHPEINGDALIVSLAALLLSLAVFGLEPAIQLTRALDIRTVLAMGASGIRPRVQRQRMIIRWQVAVATGFFIVATMFIRFTIEQARHDSGVDTDQIAITSLSPAPSTWTDDRVRAGVERVLLEAAKDPAVGTVAASTGLPFGMPSALQPVIALPGDIERAADSISVAGIATTPSLFRVLGIPIVQGRGFTDGDGPATPAVAVISELAAKRMFPSTRPIEQTLMFSLNGKTVPVTVVGVSRDTDVRTLNAPRRPLIYVPLSQHFDRRITITARTSSRVSSTIAALREAVRKVDPDLRVDLAGDGRLLSGLFEIVNSAGRGVLYLGIFTLLLSMAGLFGVQTHVVGYRTREFGVRMSLGASARQIKTMVLRDGARPVVDGLILGLWGGIAARILIRNYADLEVTVFDPWMFAIAPVPIVLAALVACYWPAVRASRVDPTTALRYE